jgi:hypothetical protein
MDARTKRDPRLAFRFGFGPEAVWIAEASRRKLDAGEIVPKKRSAPRPLKCPRFNAAFWINTEGVLEGRVHDYGEGPGRELIYRLGPPEKE